MKWLSLLAIIPFIGLMNCGPAELESSEPIVNAKQDKEEEIPVTKKTPIRCTKSIPPTCYDADGNRVK